MFILLFIDAILIFCSGYWIIVAIQDNEYENFWNKIGSFACMFGTAFYSFFVGCLKNENFNVALLISFIVCYFFAFIFYLIYKKVK